MRCAPSSASTAARMPRRSPQRSPTRCARCARNSSRGSSRKDPTRAADAWPSFRGAPPISGLLEIGNEKCQSRLKPTLVARARNPETQTNSVFVDCGRRCAASRDDSGELLLRRHAVLRVGVAVVLGDQILAVAARLVARGLGGEAAQQREQRLDLADLRLLAAGEHALDHAPLEPAGAAPLRERGLPAPRPRPGTGTPP